VEYGKISQVRVSSVHGFQFSISLAIRGDCFRVCTV
jgi:hypothetical protein